ncbi:MAG: hypothetical protein IIT82_02860, partial [Selenomonas sp.]|nr:hypothetical protein [Selenomonas sp.]
LEIFHFKCLIAGGKANKMEKLMNKMDDMELKTVSGGSLGECKCLMAAIKEREERILRAPDMTFGGKHFGQEMTALKKRLLADYGVDATLFCNSDANIYRDKETGEKLDVNAVLHRIYGMGGESYRESEWE